MFLGWPSTGTDWLKRLWNLLLWRSSKPNWCNHVKFSWGRLSLLWGLDWIPNLHRLLSTPNTLGICVIWQWYWKFAKIWNFKKCIYSFDEGWQRGNNLLGIYVYSPTANYHVIWGPQINRPPYGDRKQREQVD